MNCASPRGRKRSTFWIAYGILEYQFLCGALHRPTGAFPALGYWFIVLAAITWVGMVLVFWRPARRLPQLQNCPARIEPE